MCGGGYTASKLLLCLALLLCAAGTSGLVNHLKVSNDDRCAFRIDQYGLVAGGVYDFRILHFQGEKNKTGFVMQVVQTMETALAVTLQQLCPLLESAKPINTSTIATIKPTTNFTRNVTKPQEGMYQTYFINCENQCFLGLRANGLHKVSFEVILTEYNIRNGARSYLSVGSWPLPIVYGTMVGVYLICLVLWLWVVFRKGNNRNRVHHLMSALVLLKVLSLTFEAIELHYQDTHGVSGGWAVPYYAFLTVKGSFVFVLIVLIGSGWKFLKPYLSSKDKKILMVVIPLQILDNIALVITEQTEEGLMLWRFWVFIFRAIDIVCCIAVLAPVLWSISSLKSAAATDGKAAVNLTKMALFRGFYLSVISYMYCRLIILYLLEFTLKYKYVWVKPFFDEVAALAFYSYTAWKFRPVVGNPYLSMDSTDEGKDIAEVLQPSPTNDIEMNSITFTIDDHEDTPSTETTAPQSTDPTTTNKTGLHHVQPQDS
ncbi:seven transmembrane domain protein [Pelomyxa schiedti]|nr:seven transmembrane domain protein [Pelomyxa schiedti]